MPPPRATDLLDAWDAGLHSSSARRALLLLATARPDPIDQLAAMPLGQVDGAPVGLSLLAGHGRDLELLAAATRVAEQLHGFPVQLQ